ncbi:M1 family metallopeptidase [Chondromyces apiculatus]|uniref:M1 family metallopeptidase n=1 Tax=Chondromyces apiculatus TaxID=51 RepID=UPI0018CC5ED5|nr:M1 family aminopeptidase [Chondromyces apiculatus]
MEEPPLPLVRTEVDVQRYELSGAYDWERGRLLATVRITLSPLTDGANEIALDSAVSQVNAVRIAGGGALPFVEEGAQAQLVVDLSTVPGFARGTEVTLEIDYEAAPGDSLIAVSDRKGDPLPSRVVFTSSEPLGAERWMPCHNEPFDRAYFSIDMHVEEGEMLISNGALVTDEAGEGSRRMAYETAYTLPTYLMAFAVGAFEVESTMHGDLPVSIWHRPGLEGSYDAALAEVVGIMERFEALLGPYPFEKYAMVHLPALPTSGMENASISFQLEGVGAEPLGGDLLLTAHELAHQWFGDLVTVERWDDLWIKEGMATLLAPEGVRGHMDGAGPLTLNGNDTWADAGYAIHDTSRAPEDNYNSGPYERAAWLLTQMRTLLGEDAFWSTLRGVLTEHREGAIGTEAFLQAFEEGLGPEASARVRQAIDAVGVPTLEMRPSASGGFTLTLHDPDGALVAPFELAWVAEDGAMRTDTLAKEVPFEVTPPQNGDFLILDPRDSHPLWDLFLADDVSWEVYQGTLLPFLVPTTPAARARFLDGAAPHQEEALYTVLPTIPPQDVQAFVEDLPAEWTRALATRALCGIATDPNLDPATAAAWASVAEAMVLVPPAPVAADLFQNGGHARCSMIDPEATFAADWEMLETGLPDGEIPYMRLVFLSAFRTPAPVELGTWSNVARHASSMRTRWVAARQLRTRVPSLDPAEVPDWRAFFTALLVETDDTSVLNEAIRGVAGTMAPTSAENAEALAGLGSVLRSPWTRLVHWRAVCTAHTLVQGDSAAWSTFTESLAGVSLHPAAAEFLEDPSLCP